MKNYQIIIEYDGTNFSGWQVQKTDLTVQGIIQKVLKKLTKKNIIIHGSGRTDKGVHAIEQSAHFKTNYFIKDSKNFIKSMNFFLNKYSVSILSIKKKNTLFHARHSATERTYKYVIVNRYGSLVLDKNRAWNIEKKLDVDLMRRAARALKGKKDFSTFRSSNCSAKSPIKTIKNVRIINKNKKIEIFFISRSFLQQQVRSMVGCLKYVGEKKWTIKDFEFSLFSKLRKNCAPPAPASGLFLYKVKY